MEVLKMTDLRTQVEQRMLEKFNKTDLMSFNKKVFETHGTYFCVDQFSEKGSIILEFADNYEEAVNNIFWDGDSYPRAWGCDKIVEEMISVIG